MRWFLAIALAALLSIAAHAQNADSVPAAATPPVCGGDLSGTYPACVVNTANGVAIATKNASGQIASMASGVSPSTIWSSTARQVMASASDVSCFSATGTGPGLTIPANGPYAGNQYLLNCVGVYSVPNLNAATVTAKVKWGSTTVASVVVPAIAILTTNFPFSATASCTIITSGATGTVECVASMCFSAALTAIAPLCSYAITASPVTIDTTTASKIDMTAAWSTVAGGQTASTIIANAMILF